MGNQEVYKDHERPITLMRQLTVQGIPFKLEFRRKRDGKRRVVHRALLRPQSLGTVDRNSKYKLQFIDRDTDQMGSVFIPLILSVNDKKIVL